MCHAQRGVAFIPGTGPELSWHKCQYLHGEWSQQLNGVGEWMGMGGEELDRAIILPCPVDQEVKISLGASPSLSIGYLVPFPFPYGFCLTLVLIFFCLWCPSRNVTVFDKVYLWPFKWRYDTSWMRIKKLYSQSSDSKFSFYLLYSL